MPDELKPCQCGGKAVLDRADLFRYRVKCIWDVTCKRGTSWFHTEQEAIDAWNSRVGEVEKG